MRLAATDGVAFPFFCVESLVFQQAHELSKK